ncbi:MAG: mannosyltransferase [Micromonosporaceae bacterium]|nr:mannosyltransferase [Micromonosporaceae bacterium]
MQDAVTIAMPRPGASEASVEEDPWGEDQDATPARPATDGAAWRIGSWLVPGLLMGALSVVGAGAPGLWMDELATWGMATSSWRENWSIVHWTDVTDAPYYLLMRAWAELFGTSDLALRAPSMLAMTAAAAVIGALGARLFAPRTGLVAGVIFALLPTSTRYAQEARPYALTLLAAALATLLLVLATDQAGFWRFAAYGASASIVGLSHVVALLLLAGHGWAVFAFRRKVAGRWLVAAFIGALPAAGLLWLGERHAAAMTRIPDLSLFTATPKELFGATALSVVLVVLALFSLPLRYAAGIYTAWAVVPPLMLLLIAQATPIWLPQSLLFTLPAWATLGAAALCRARAGWGAGMLVVIALIGLPVQVAFREPDGHRQATRQLAEIIEAGMRPGDGVVYGSADAEWVGRATVAHYLPADRRPKDLLATGPQRNDSQLLTAECTDVAKCLGDTSRLWVVRLGEQKDPIRATGAQKERLLRTRYRVAQVWQQTGLTLALLVADRARA